MPGNLVPVLLPVPRFLPFALACAFLLPVSAAERASALPVAPVSASWKIHQTAPAVYPPHLIMAGIGRGEARVRVSLAADGTLLDALVIVATHRAFGEEALRAAKSWRYQAGHENGEPIGIVSDISFLFYFNGPVGVEKRLAMIGDDSDPTASEPFAYRAESLKRLDRIPTPTHVVPPIFPQAWIDRGIAGSVTVEFYIDETGRTRIPLVTATDHPLLGGSAAAAVAEWRFNPPTRRGTPVLTRAEQVFFFHPEKK